MCYLCEEYGNPEYGGGLWYLNPYNYARNMYTLRLPGGGPTAKRGSYAKAIGGAKADIRPPREEDLIAAIEKCDMAEYLRVQQEMNAAIDMQVVPLKDANKILEVSYPIGLMSCVCRKGRRARDERNEEEYTCMGIGMGMLKWERWPERYKGSVKLLSVEEAKEWQNEMDRKGFAHILMMLGTPFIEGICQCDYPDCGEILRMVDFGIGALKSHYVAELDYDECNGCGICAQRCPFGALKMEVTRGKANIDQFKCYGCGLCETGCPTGAISLLERKSLPALAEVWR